MSTPRFGRIQKATALVPLALLSAAWTASIAGVGTTTASAASASEAPASTLPDGTDVPAEVIKAPASVSVPGNVAPGVKQGRTKQVVSSSSTSAIPAAALSAYQRAATVINAADKGCELPWQLVAAIGRVESDHGRTNGNHLDDKGVARPGIYGIALDGSHKTSRVLDTDAGQYDSDAKFDRAVGPMQFIPSTWSVVGVDADGDAERNPQDVDDAALATAVYLCSGDDDLSTTAGQRSAVYRYNHSNSYVDLVLSVMEAYQDGDFTAVPNSTSAGYFVPESAVPTRTPTPHPQPQPQQPAAPQTAQSQPEPQAPAPTTPAPTTPAAPQDDGGKNDGGIIKNGGGNGGGHGGLPDVPIVGDVVDDVLTIAEATVKCTLEGLSQLLNPDAFQKCLDKYTK